MMVKRIQTGLLAGSVVLASFGLVQAQTAATATPSTDSATAVPSTAEGEGRTPEEILASAHAEVVRMETTSDNIDRMLRGAREERDIVKALCLDDKLNQINVTTRTAEDRVASMESAVSSGNLGRLSTDEKVLAALVVHANEISTEADQCIGAEQGGFGKTTLSVKMDPKIPVGNTTSLPPTGIVSTPPVAASPTL